MDNLQVKYRVLTKAYSVGVASHFLAIVVSKWECVYVQFYKGKYTVLRKAYTVGVASHFLAVLTNGQLLQLQEAFCGRFSALSHESATQREFGGWRIMESLWHKSESCFASLMHQIFGFVGEEFLEHVPVREEAPGGGCPSLSLCLIWEEFCSSSNSIRRRW
jgi:hypothetical protein